MGQAKCRHRPSLNSVRGGRTRSPSGDVVPVLDHSFVALDGALASDLAVVNGARVSSTRRPTNGREGGHWIPDAREQRKSLEHGYFRFVVKAPLS